MANRLGLVHHCGSERDGMGSLNNGAAGHPRPEREAANGSVGNCEEQGKPGSPRHWTEELSEERRLTRLATASQYISVLPLIPPTTISARPPYVHIFAHNSGPSSPALGFSRGASAQRIGHTEGAPSRYIQQSVDTVLGWDLDETKAGHADSRTWGAARTTRIACSFLDTGVYPGVRCTCIQTHVSSAVVICCRRRRRVRHGRRIPT